MDLLGASESDVAAIDGPEAEAEETPAATTPDAPEPQMSRRQRAEFMAKASKALPELERRTAEFDTIKQQLQQERDERVRTTALLEEFRRQLSDRQSERATSSKQDEHTKVLSDLDERIKQAYAGDDINVIMRLNSERQSLVAQQMLEQRMSEFEKKQANSRPTELPPAYMAVRMKNADVDSNPGGPQLVRTIYDSLLASGRADAPETFDAAFMAARTILGTKAPRGGNGGAYSQPSPSNANEAGSRQSESPSSKLPAHARKTAEKMVESGMMESVDEYAKMYFDGRTAR